MSKIDTSQKVHRISRRDVPEMFCYACNETKNVTKGGGGGLHAKGDPMLNPTCP